VGPLGQQRYSERDRRHQALRPATRGGGGGWLLQQADHHPPRLAEI